MLIKTSKGLYCPAGNFYIDPLRAVEHAIITHAHSDHARRGSKAYYCAAPGTALLKARLGQTIIVHPYPYGKKFFFNDVTVSFHPAGHILGSAQVRVEFCGEVWVVSGDYKRESDPTCDPFEPLLCDVFITEATFGTPAFKWKKNINFGDEIFSWWQRNVTRGMHSVLFAYSLGKAQRILGSLFNITKEQIICHHTTEALNQCYRTEGIQLASSISASDVTTEVLSGRLFLVPPAFMRSSDRRILGNQYKTAFASGWMTGKNNSYDRGFVMSDHADWEDLLTTILETKAQRVFVQHRGYGALIKELRSLGIKAHPDSALLAKDPRQFAFF